ncbi:glycoside hydrolase family 6 protein [Actinospica sp.]|uniref:glycoside hydrolase family 6 protein n=1 Tax=Actinospica sp. TaxID=1872142 RepID=UPI002C873EE2|nr:glycoside hydrolase family 6 protein [Actinospica sp.]HWG25282.1 glycoside hydrolase family 6 protein [Actinospica sp.]
MIVVSRTSACAAGPPQESGGAFSAGTRFYLFPNSAVEYWDTHNTANPLEPAIASRIGDVPSAIWFTQYDPDRIAGQVRQITAQAAAEGTVPVLVLYDIPEINCSTTPPSGAPSIAAYESWASAFASGLGDHSAIVIVEPDGLSLQTCLNAQQAAARDGAIGYAGSAVHKADPNARVYFDAGNSAWNPPQVQAQRLATANVATSANGIVSNVSNFLPTAAEVSYDEEILADLGDPSGLHIVVDTSRNGNGGGSTWCDPSGRALGKTPTVDTGDPLVDAYLWVKDPGQADGCAASAGAFDPELAYALIANGPGGAPTLPAASAAGTAAATGAGVGTGAAPNKPAATQQTYPGCR